MRLHGLVYYRGKSDTWTDNWRDEDRKAWALVKAIKGAEFTGVHRFKHKGSVYQITNSGAGRALALKMAASALVRKIIAAEYSDAAMIAIPSSTHTSPGKEFTAYRLAEAIYNFDSDYIPLAPLHFQIEMKKSSDGGTRNPIVIEKNLRLSPGFRLPKKAILIDDVCTTGAHLKAAKWFLETKGVSVEDAFVIGRTTWSRPENMLKMKSESLDAKKWYGF